MVRSHWKYSVIKGHGILQHTLYSTFVRKCLYCLHFLSICSHIQPDGFSSLSSLSKFSPLSPNSILCEVLCLPNQHTQSGTCQDMDSRNLLAMNFDCNQLQKQSGYFTFNVIPHFSTTVTKFVLWRTVPCVKTNVNEVFFIQVVLFPAILVYTRIKQSLTEQNHWKEVYLEISLK
jgi:hypothetical protein